MTITTTITALAADETRTAAKTPLRISPPSRYPQCCDTSLTVHARSMACNNALLQSYYSINLDFEGGDSAITLVLIECNEVSRAWQRQSLTLLGR
jgi:hypothetical protein